MYTAARTPLRQAPTLMAVGTGGRRQKYSVRDAAVPSFSQAAGRNGRPEAFDAWSRPIAYLLAKAACPLITPCVGCMCVFDQLFSLPSFLNSVRALEMYRHWGHWHRTRVHLRSQNISGTDYASPAAPDLLAAVQNTFYTGLLTGRPRQLAEPCSRQGVVSLDRLPRLIAKSRAALADLSPLAVLRSNGLLN